MNRRRFIAASAMCGATLLEEDPSGLPTEPYGVIAPTVATAIHETVWKTVREHPESGVRSK